MKLRLSDKFGDNSDVLRKTQQIFAIFPYFGHQSQKMQEELSSLFIKYFNDIQFNILLINDFKIGSFFIIKIDFQRNCELLWFINLVCVRCTSEYIGSTTRALCVRVAEHAGRSHRTSHLLTSPPYSSKLPCDSPVSPDNFSILGSCKNVLDLRILQSLYIFKLKRSLNNIQSAHPLFLVDK